MTVDPRTRLVLAVAIAGAALAASSLAGVGVLLVACGIALPVTGVSSRVVGAALRPLLPLFVLIVVVQSLVASQATVPVAFDLEVQSGLAVAALHVAQVTIVLLALLAVTATTPPSHMARALRSLLAPLRLLRLPVDDAALVLAIGLGFVPVMGQELDRLRLAQRARGIELAELGPAARVRVLAAVAIPLVVLAFRRARQLAEAMHIRGYARGARRVELAEWRLGVSDLLFTILVVVVACAALIV